MNNRLNSCFALMLMTLFYHNSLYSWIVSPSIVSVDPSKPQAFFEITADENDKSVPIEITAAHRMIDEYGEETISDASSEFLIYPSQFILKKGLTKKIRVLWKGNKDDVVTEKAYRIIMTGLPIDVSDSAVQSSGETKAEITMVTRYVNSFYVTPKNAKSDVKVAQSGLEISPNGKRFVIEMTNNGLAHEYLNDLTFKVKHGEDNYEITQKMVQKSYPEGINILAKQKRFLYIPFQEDSGDQANADANIKSGSAIPPSKENTEGQESKDPVSESEVKKEVDGTGVATVATETKDANLENEIPASESEVKKEVEGTGVTSLPIENDDGNLENKIPASESEVKKEVDGTGVTSLPIENDDGNLENEIPASES